MAGYSAEKDKLLQKFPKKTFGLTRVRIMAYSYDGGEVKIQVVRQRRNSEDSEEWKPAKLGRLSYEEVKWIGRSFRKTVIPWMEDYFHEHGTKGPKNKKGGKKKKKGKE